MIMFGYLVSFSITKKKKKWKKILLSNISNISAKINKNNSTHVKIHPHMHNLSQWFPLEILKNYHCHLILRNFTFSENLSFKSIDQEFKIKNIPTMGQIFKPISCHSLLTSADKSPCKFHRISNSCNSSKYRCWPEHWTVSKWKLQVSVHYTIWL